MIKAILFDLDNTLIDFVTMKDKCCEAAVDAMIAAGLKVKKKQALKILFKLYYEHGLSHRYIFQKFLKKVNGKVDYRLVAHGIVAYRKIRGVYLTPYENVIPTLVKLKKKYKLAIITDAHRVKGWLRLVTMGIDHLFDVVITAADVGGRNKKYAAPFKAALRALKIKPEEAVMVGDRISRDIEIPNRLGMTTVFARYGDPRLKEGEWLGMKTFFAHHGIPKISKGKSGADFEINDIEELEKVLKDC